MIRELEHRIRDLAHKIWEREGRPSDRADIHWNMAAAEIAAETPTKPAAKPRAPRAAAATASKVAKAEKAPKPAAKAAPKPKATPKPQTPMA